MAHIEVDREEFEELVGEEVEEGYLREKASFLGVHWNPGENDKWDVEVYPNRPDLLSVEGLARAYRGYMDLDPGKDEFDARVAVQELEVDESVEKVRPYIGGAIVRGAELDERALNGLIQLQEKLHKTHGREREKVAIGLHDTEELNFPFRYRAADPSSVSFVPLEREEEMDLQEIVENHGKGKEYGHIVEGNDVYPVIEDARGKVLSFPPIINNSLTEVDEDTEEIFVDVTGTDEEAVEEALNIVVTALIERGGTAEKVIVDAEEMPNLTHEGMMLDTDYLRSVSGLELEDEEIARNMRKMNYGARTTSKGVWVQVPPYRTDIMHQYDLIEDVVVAHGYKNIEPELPGVHQQGEINKVEDYTNIARDVLSGTGALETHTYILSSPEKLSGRMVFEKGEIATMENSLNEDFSAVRNWMLPSLLDTLKRNRHHSYPQKFFEVADVVEMDGSSTGASNRRKASYIVSGEDVDFNDVKEVLQVLERDLGVSLEVKEEEFGCFKGGRSGRIVFGDQPVGMIGEFSSQVLENWNLERSSAGFEIDFEEIVEQITF